MPRTSTFFMLLKSTRHWLELDADARRTVFDETLALVFNGFPDLRMTHYAAGLVHARCSDVIVWETTDAAQYHEAIEALGAEPFFGAPLFEIIDVIAGVSDDDDVDGYGFGDDSQDSVGDRRADTARATRGTALQSPV